MNPHQKPQEDVVADLAAVDAILARWRSTPDNARPSIKLGLLRRLRAMLDAPTYEAGRRDMREAAGKVYVPRDDDARAYSDSTLPGDMIFAGIETLERANTDMWNYVPGETLDWDSGMIVVAVYRAMLAALPAEPLGGEQP